MTRRYSGRAFCGFIATATSAISERCRRYPTGTIATESGVNMFKRAHGSAVATAFVFLAIFAVVSVAQENPSDRKSATETLPVEPLPVEPLKTPKTPLNVLIDEINNELKTSRRSLSRDEFIRTHTNIATLIDDLRRVSPDDPHVPTFLPERWLSLKLLAGLRSTNARSPVDRIRELNTEIDEVRKTTTDSRLKCAASFFHTMSKLDDPIDGPAAVSLSEQFVSEWPKDNRSAEILHVAITKLHSAWYMRMALIALLVLISAVTAITSLSPQARTRKRLRLSIILGLLGSVTIVILITAFPHFPGVIVIESITSNLILPTIQIIGSNLLSLVCTYRFVFFVVVASATALSLVAIRQRSEAAIFHRFSKVRQLILGFSLASALCFAVDAYLISRQSTEAARRVAQEYPNSFRGRLAQGQIRKREQIGKQFELEFTDAISGRAVSMKNLQGKVVVVEFWATSCGPCVHEIPELKRLFAKYHDQGVEFIGVSEDAPESEGGLEKLKAFVVKEQIPWPQYYQGHDVRALLTGSAVNDFSESWGIDGIPAIFLIDRSGNLYSTEARGRLETLIPLLLEE